MSKEQTPITAEEFLRSKKLLSKKSKKFVIRGVWGVCLLNDLMEQYAQAKVLEALESKAEIIRERLKNCEELKDESIFDRTFKVALIPAFKQALEDITETEVKPNYKLK